MDFFCFVLSFSHISCVVFCFLILSRAAEFLFVKTFSTTWLIAILCFVYWVPLCLLRALSLPYIYLPTFLIRVSQNVSFPLFSLSRLSTVVLLFPVAY